MKQITCDNVINLTKENFMNHSKDKVFIEIDFYESTLFVFITKMYKIVKIYNKDLIYIINLYDFCPILSCAYVKSNFLKTNIKRQIKIINKKRDFSVMYRNKVMFRSSYYKCKMLMNNIKAFYFSYILNLPIFAYIDNKKKELNLIIGKIKSLQIKNKEDVMIEQILHINFSESFDINIDKKFVYHLFVLYYLKQ